MVASRRKLAKTVVDRMEKLGSKQALNELAAYMITHHQTGDAPIIVSDIEAELASRGRVVADVISARPLDVTLRDQLSKLVAKHTNASEVTLREEVDPELIGGVQLRAGGYELDSTIATKIKRLKTL
jgi:F-type H+-transporting ATPase subunit delta